MRLNNYEMNLPSYSIGEKVYEHIPAICEPYGKKVLIIGGEQARKAAEEKIREAISSSSLTIIGSILYGKDCTYQAVEELRKQKLYQEADMVFAVGGGKALDTCKCLCIEEEKPIFTFPTIASNCAACTSVSIMYHEDGTFLKPHFFLHPPKHAFINTEVMAHAPERYLWAGIGDTYAKYYEAKISSRGEQLEHFTALGVAVSQMCLDPLLQYGKEEYEDNKKGICSYELEQVVLAIVVTTAIASILLTRDFTPDYNSGLAHAVFYALTAYPVIEEKHLHGEVVGFGVLIALLYDGQMEEFEKIYQLNRKLGLPVSLQDIDITPEKFIPVMEQIPHMSDVRHYPYPITEENMNEVMEYLENRSMQQDSH